MIKKEELKSRIEEISQKCKEAGLDAFVVTSGDNLYYLTGKSIMPFERPFILIIPSDGDPVFLVPQLELDHLRSGIPHIQMFETYYEYPSPAEISWPEKLKELTAGYKKIGTDLYTRSEIFNALQANAQVHPFNWVYNRRFVKSEAEILILKEASKYIRSSMLDFIKHIRRGAIVMDTLNPARKTQKKVLIDRKFNVDFLAYNFLSAGWPGAQSAEPHSIPNPTTQFTDGPNVMILSYRIDGYAVELERTFFTSVPSELETKRFQDMLNARQIAFAMCKPGAKTHDIDKAARDYLIAQGYEKNIIHRTGHGMGVSNHEGPFLAIGSDTILEPGMVLTIEPGIYFKGHGAYRHSDTIVITEDGYENLTGIPTGLNFLTRTRPVGPIDRIKRMAINRIIR